MLELIDIKGVGENVKKKLNELGITNVFELFSFIPSKYIDLNSYTKFWDAELNQLSLFYGKVEKISEVNNYKKGYFNVIFSDNLDGRTSLKANFFNMPFLHDKFEIGQNYKILSKFISSSEFVISNPILELESEKSKLQGIYTVYPLKNVLGQNVFKNIIFNALDQIMTLNYEGQVGQIYKEIALIFDKIHRPKSIDEANYYISELAKIDLAICLSIYKKSQKSAKNTRKVFYKSQFYRNNDYISALPFGLTDSQEEALKDIESDLFSDYTMSRIISGDVGSGKTVVAFYAMYLAALNGYQSALMAPTEILAKQHFANFNKFFEKINLKVTLLTSSTSRLEKELISNDLKNGEIQCVIGTQSLISDEVKYKNLAVGIIDEQHKFGVNDRKMLENKGASDILSLTATPIPRSMALTFYEDIAVSRIEKREDAITHIKTSIINNISSTLSTLIAKANDGNKVFIVCPAIVDIEGNDFYSIEKFENDFSKQLSNCKYATMHGKLSNDEKNNIMNQFATGDINMLVATSIIEVGIDTKATDILILNADRFGLSSLHQLRGRVGRDGSKANCYLHNGSKSQKALDRLTIIKDNLDGHKIAEYDFLNRGPGEFLGLKQSGQSKTPLFGLNMNASILLKAKDYAQTKLKDLTLQQLKLLTRNSQDKFDEFLSDIQKITLNS